MCRSWFNVSMRVWTAERRAIINTRIASTLPSRLFGNPVAVPDRAARGRCDGVDRIGLALAMPGLTIGSVDFDNPNTGPGQVSG
jgi:hypothetical protein